LKLFSFKLKTKNPKRLIKIGNTLKNSGKNSLSPILVFFEVLKIIPSKKFVPKPIKASFNRNPDPILKKDKTKRGVKASQLVLCAFK
jgi:hypothetical protein